jgi:tetratricopeptide (TPR) repeat protein
MRALVAGGRGAEALSRYATGRARLVAELGAEPGPELRAIHEAVLRGDLDRTPRPRPATTGNGAGRSVPAQLPADVSGFSGRAEELAELDRLCGTADGADRIAGASTAVVISAVAGTAGVGKTALAVHWAHRVRDRFPDGQLYVNLRGYDPDQPMSPSDALIGFLASLGLPGPDIPVDVDDRAARYRTEVSGRRLLVVVDNASSVEQVRPLLPGTPSATVVVTSRDSLPGLVAVHGARRLDLDLLPLPDAVALLRTLIGPRVDADPPAAAALAEQCARLPLALRVAAELAAARPANRLSGLVAELTDQQGRMDLLDAGGDPRAAVGTVFSWSLQHLPPDAARMFRLLGLHPGPDADLYAAAALADTTAAQARRTLHSLTRAHLVQHLNSGRFGMHDLLRAYATSLATGADSADDTPVALNRLFDYYLATAATAMDTLYPAETRYRPTVPLATTPAPVLADPDTARTWLDTERPILAAVAAYTADHGWSAHTIRLAGALHRYLTGGHHTDGLAIHGHALRAARQTGDRAGEARSLSRLGCAHMLVGSFELAADHLQQALALFRQAGDRDGEAGALNNLGLVDERLGRYEPATDHLQQALALCRQAGDRSGEARAMANLGSVERQMGRLRRAADHLQQALTLARQIRDRYSEAHAVNNLGLVEQRLGQHHAAADHHRQALALTRQLGDRTGEAFALDNLGAVHTRLGRPDQATELHQQALSRYCEAGDRDGQAWAFNGLGEAAQAADHLTDALTHHTGALAIATEIGNRDQQARAHTGLGHAHSALGEPTQARRRYQHALALYTALGTTEADDIRAYISAGD